MSTRPKTVCDGCGKELAEPVAGRITVVGYARRYRALNEFASLNSTERGGNTLDFCTLDCLKTALDHQDEPA